MTTELFDRQLGSLGKGTVLYALKAFRRLAHLKSIMTLNQKVYFGGNRQY